MLKCSLLLARRPKLLLEEPSSIHGHELALECTKSVARGFREYVPGAHCVYSIMRPIPVMESGIKIGVGVSNTSVLQRLTACDVKRHKRDYFSDRFIQMSTTLPPSTITMLTCTVPKTTYTFPDLAASKTMNMKS
jgi:hypothetical protein